MVPMNILTMSGNSVIVSQVTVNRLEIQKMKLGVIAGEQDENALSQNGDMVEIEQPLNAGDKLKVRAQVCYDA